MFIKKDTAPKLEEGDEWFSVERSAEYVGVSRRTIYNWVAKDRLITCRTAGGSLRISKFSLYKGNNSGDTNG